MILPLIANAQEAIELALLRQYTNDRHYNCICWLTSHNSFAYRKDETGSIKNTHYLRPNQVKNIKEQLEFGVRGFMIDLYPNINKERPNTSIILSHRRTEMSWDNYDQEFSYPFLQTIKEWLNDPKNIDDIITIHLESYVRSYRKIVDELDAVEAKDKNKTNEPKLKSYLFDLCEYNGGKSQEGKAECFWPNGEKTIKWPTLGEMRQKNKRLVIFSDKAEDAGYGIMHVSRTMETQYDISNFSVCEKRLDGRVETAPVFVLNQLYSWAIVPGLGYFKYHPAYINTYEELVRRTGTCFLQEGQWPNFIAVDNVSGKGGKERELVLAINKNNKEHCCFATESISEAVLEGADKGDNTPHMYEHDEL